MTRTPSAESPQPVVSIAAVERETGLSKDTLRVWERRYGFPTPTRDAKGERLYAADQILRLRLIKRLMDQGHRPGQTVALSAPALQKLIQHDEPIAARSMPPLPGEGVELDTMLVLLRTHDIHAVRQQLAQWLLRLGLGAFVTQVLAPLNTRVGEAWMQGRLEVFEEHLYSEAVQGTLRHALQTLPAGALNGTPRVLLTTLPGETHGLGLLMAEALMTLQGCHCISLGVQTPISDIARAAQAHNVDIVGLSFTSLMPSKAIKTGLNLLRELLPAHRELWVGGASAALPKRGMAGVLHLSQLTQIPAELQRWRCAPTR